MGRPTIGAVVSGGVYSGDPPLSEMFTLTPCLGNSVEKILNSKPGSSQNQPYAIPGCGSLTSVPL